MFFIFGLLWGFRELEVSTPKGAKKRSHPQVENDNACFPVGGPDSLQCPCQLIRDKPVVFLCNLLVSKAHAKLNTTYESHPTTEVALSGGSWMLNC